MQTNFDPNSTDFYYQWGKECAINNLTTDQLDYMIKEIPTVTKQIQSDIYQGYKENIVGELRTDFYQWGKDCAAQNMSLTDANNTVKTEITHLQTEKWNTFFRGYLYGTEQKETEKVEPETRTFEIYYTDLNESAKKEICETFDTSPEEENWDMNILPLAIFERTMEEEED